MNQFHKYMEIWGTGEKTGHMEPTFLSVVVYLYLSPSTEFLFVSVKVSPSIICLLLQLFPTILSLYYGPASSLRGSRSTRQPAFTQPLLSSYSTICRTNTWQSSPQQVLVFPAEWTRSHEDVPLLFLSAILNNTQQGRANTLRLKLFLSTPSKQRPLVIFKWLLLWPVTARSAGFSFEYVPQLG